VEATSAPCGAFTGRLAYPIGTDNKLAVTLACGGVAVYDVTDKLAPDLDGNWPAAADCNDGLSALHVAEGPDNHMYVTFINMDVGGIGVFDVDDVESGPIVGTHTTPEGMYTTPFNAQALIPAPSSLPNGEPAFYVADGRGGLHYIQFPTVSP